MRKDMVQNLIYHWKKEPKSGVMQFFFAVVFLTLLRFSFSNCLALAASSFFLFLSCIIETHAEHYWNWLDR